MTDGWEGAAIAVTKCPDCHREVSTLAVACPHCGRPLASVSAPPTAKQPGFVMGILCLFVLLPILGGWVLWSGIEAIRTREDFDAAFGIPLHSKGTEAVVSGCVKCGVGLLLLLPVVFVLMGLLLRFRKSVTKADES